MSNLLAVTVSPRLTGSISRTLAAHFIEQYQSNHLGTVTVRDLLAAPVPYVDHAWMGGAYTPADQHTPEMAAAIKVSNDLIAELRAADHLLIATPMFNFSIPAVLKAWIDQIVRVGVTVSTGNVGLLTGKKASIIIATGGDFSPGSPIEAYNQASGYLRAVLGWIGITDINIILADRSRAGGNAETALPAFASSVSALAA